MNCPVCRIALSQGRTKSPPLINLDYCRHCGGIWLDRDELELFVAQPKLIVEFKRNCLQTKKGSGRDCPRCATQMFVDEVPQIKTVLDLCATCGGTWLDKGELNQIIHDAGIFHPPPATNLNATGYARHSGLSGNEIFCLAKKALAPGDLVIGNSVYAMGIAGQFSAFAKTLAGGEVPQVTSLIADGRHRSYERMIAEAKMKNGVGITGVSNQLVEQPGGIEFLSVGSCVHEMPNAPIQKSFTSSSNGQELYCQLDSGFTPLKFVFGNVAYSIGVGRGVSGILSSFGRGEVAEYTEIFNQTRHAALSRLVSDGKSVNANAIVGIETSILPFMGCHEMVMMGTASDHPVLRNRGASDPITSDLTNEEMWNLINLGYMPQKLLLGVSVYSLGITGGIMSSFRALVRGEQPELTSLIYEARESAIGKIEAEAKALGADDVVGIQTYIYHLGSGLIEFLAIGTAVKKIPGLTTLSPLLIPQAVIRDRETFINAAGFGYDLNSRSGGFGSIVRSSRNPVSIIVILVIYAFLAWIMFMTKK